MSRVKYDPDIFNIDLLRQAVEWAVAESKKDYDESQWDQGMWAAEGPLGRGRRIKVVERYGDGPNDVEVTTYGPDQAREVKCGSAFCVAGWTCYAAGDKFVAYVPMWWNEETAGSEMSPDYAVPKGSNEAFEISERARVLLGITYEEADELFAGHNEISDIKRIARKIARRRGEVL